MRLDCARRWLTEASTISELTESGQRLSFILEDKYRGDNPKDKVPGKTAIPCGVYEVVISHSPKFGVDVPLLLNVPGFSGVRIHWGNDAKDTEGCLITGLDRGPDQVQRSKLAYGVVFQRIQAARARGELVHIDIHLAAGGTCP